MLRVVSYILARVEDVRQREERLSLMLSVVVGALVSLVVVAFVLLTAGLSSAIFPVGSSAWRRVLAPTLGALVTGVLLVRFFPEARGSGIPQTRAAIFIHDGRISARTVFGKFTCCVISLASGMALGREGPSVHLGAGITSVIARHLGLSITRVKWLIPVGVSAALAAAFNTPIAAVLFALEEIMGDMHAPILGSVVLSSVTSWMVLHLVLGDEPLFHVAAYHLVSSWELTGYVVLGIVGGLGSVAFVRLLLALRKRFLALPVSTRWLQPAVGGLAVGMIGFFVPQILGVGYDQVERVLDGEVVLRIVILFAVLKIVATAMCFASGNAGGIFGPSLFIGAMIGGAVGEVAHTLFPLTTAEPGAYALVGMGTAFAGIVRTPLTSVIMIFEVTRNYSIIVPLMISNMIAFYISRSLQRAPVYEALAHQDGIHLPSGPPVQSSARLEISAAMSSAPSALMASVTVREAMACVGDGAHDSYPVNDADGFVTLVGRQELAAALGDGLADVTLGALVLPNVLSDERSASRSALHVDEPLAHALSRMGETRQTTLPVVSRSNARSLLGVVTLTDILEAFGVDTVEQMAVAELPR